LRRNQLAHNNLANLYFREGLFPEAVPLYREALRLDPSYADAHANLGLALAATGRNAEAVTHYREALRLLPPTLNFAASTPARRPGAIRRDRRSPAGTREMKKKLPTAAARAALVAAGIAMLAALPFLVAGPGANFIALDDRPYVSQNPAVAAGLTHDGVRWAFTTFHEGNWHPLTWFPHYARREPSTRAGTT
jgi:tetratricopeptide (TPR) repeat protein